MLEEEEPTFNHPSWAAHIDAQLAGGIADAVSRQRLVPYGVKTNEIEAVARHGRNILVSESFYPILHMLEVVMRNRLHDAFCNHFQSDDWYEQPWLNHGHARLVREAQQDVISRGRDPTPDRVIAELRFGFWCGMFNGAYEVRGGPWPLLLCKVLPRVPKSWRTRPKVRMRIEEARVIRNRVFHHESIADIRDLADRHRRLVELLGWFSPEARRHLEHLCRFGPVFRNALSRPPRRAP